MSLPNENNPAKRSPWYARATFGMLGIALTLAGVTMDYFQKQSDALKIRSALQESMLSLKTLWILEKPDTFTLLSISPFVDMRRWATGKTNLTEIERNQERFYEHSVLGKVNITNLSEQIELYMSITNGLRETQGPAGEHFDPHYALRLQREGKTVDLIMCFECRAMEEVSDDTRRLAISSKPKETFKKAFERHGLVTDTNDFFGIYGRESDNR